MSVAVAEGPSLLSECNGESSVLLDLNAMFPSLDHEVIVTVLQAHEGRVEAVVDYLMNVVGGGGEEVDEEEELQGPFSDDIGGPPEIVPSFLQEPAAEDNDIGDPPEIVPSFLQEPAAEDNDIGGPPEILPSFLREPVAGDDDIGGPPEIVPSFLQEPAADDRSLTESPDPLPTYEQACLPIEPGPPPYVCVAHEASLPAPQSLMEPNPSHQRNREHCVHVPAQQETQISREHHLSREAQWPAQNSHQASPCPSTQAEACSTPASQQQQLRSQGRRGKLRKLAQRLGRRRNSDYKVDQEKNPSPPLPYLRLLDDDELEDISGTQ